jgi:FdhD protein
MSPAVNFPIYRYQASGWQMENVEIIAESQISLTVNGKEWLAFACTPEQLPELAMGYLYNEGVITTVSEISSIQMTCQDKNVDVWLTHPAEPPTLITRTSGCTGGVSSSQSRHLPPPNLTHTFISPEVILTGMEQLFAVQDKYHQSRGIHCSTLGDGQVVIFSAEDIGRHNTLDKLAGQIIQAPHLPDVRIIYTTGRVSHEMAIKSARMGAVAIVSLTTPTEQAVEICQELGITLVGYARRTQFVAYTHSDRLGRN